MPNPITLRSTMPMGNGSDQVRIQPAGFYVTVGTNPTVCMFPCGSQHVNLQLTRDEALYMADWLKAQADRI